MDPDRNDSFLEKQLDALDAEAHKSQRPDSIRDIDSYNNDRFLAKPLDAEAHKPQRQDRIRNIDSDNNDSFLAKQVGDSDTKTLILQRRERIKKFAIGSISTLLAAVFFLFILHLVTESHDTSHYIVLTVIAFTTSLFLCAILSASQGRRPSLSDFTKDAEPLSLKMLVGHGLKFDAISICALVLCTGIFCYATYLTNSTVNFLKLGAASYSWPTTVGTVTTSEINRYAINHSETRSRNAWSEKRAVPVIAYTYQVNGLTKSSTTDVLDSIANPGVYLDKSPLAQAADTLQPGDQIRVHYNPENPDMSVIWPGIYWDAFSGNASWWFAISLWVVPLFVLFFRGERCSIIRTLVFSSLICFGTTLIVKCAWAMTLSCAPQHDFGSIEIINRSNETPPLSPPSPAKKSIKKHFHKSKKQ